MFVCVCFVGSKWMCKFTRSCLCVLVLFIWYIYLFLLIIIAFFLLQFQAHGSLYVDDGRSFAYLKNAQFLEISFNFSENVLRMAQPSGSYDVSTSRIEKIIILGLQNSAPKQAFLLVQGSASENSLNVLSHAPHAIVIRAPDAPLNTAWQIRVKEWRGVWCVSERSIITKLFTMTYRMFSSEFQRLFFAHLPLTVFNDVLFCFVFYRHRCPIWSRGWARGRGSGARSSGRGNTPIRSTFAGDICCSHFTHASAGLGLRDFFNLHRDFHRKENQMFSYC